MGIQNCGALSGNFLESLQVLVDKMPEDVLKHFRQCMMPKMDMECQTWLQEGNLRRAIS